MYFGKVFFYNFAPEMAKHLKIIVMIFALGMFIVPNQMLFAQNTETACCTTEKSEKDCCSALVLLKNLVLVTILPKNHNLVIAIVQNVLLAH